MASSIPTCSVIIATHQRLPMLKAALDSALNQQNVDLEVIVVENGSTDGTADYLATVRDPRVVPLIHSASLGATPARNEGLRHARGEWVGFLDDDDLWAPDKLQSQLAAAAKASRDWSYTGCVYIDRASVVTGGLPPPLPDEMAARCAQRYAVPGGLSSMIWRASVLDQGGLLEPRLTYMVDWDLSLRLLRRGLPAAVSQPLVAWRQHGGNMSVRAGDYLAELACIESKFADMRRGKPLDVAFQYRVAGSENLRAGERAQALSWYLRAVRSGDKGSLVRAAAAFVPSVFWPALRKRVLADAYWMRKAEPWLREHRERMTLTAVS